MAKQMKPPSSAIISCAFQYISLRLAWSVSARACLMRSWNAGTFQFVSFQSDFSPNTCVRAWSADIRRPQYTAQNGTLSQTLSQYPSPETFFTLSGTPAFFADSWYSWAQSTAEPQAPSDVCRS